MLVEGLHLTDIGTIDIVTNLLQGALQGVFMSPDVKHSNDKNNALATLVHYYYSRLPFLSFFAIMLK